MIFKVILLFSLVLLVHLSLKVIRTCKVPSLLIIQALLVALVLDIPCCFLEPLIGNVEDMTLVYDTVIEQRILLSLTIINFIGILGAFILLSFQQRKPLTFENYHRAPGAFRVEPSLLGLFAAAVGVCFIIFLRSNMVSTVFSSAADVMGDYSSYYLLRYELSQSNVSTFVRYALIFSMYLGLPLVNMISLQNAILEKNKLWYLAWVLTFGLWVFGAIAMLQKAPIVIAILSNIFVLFFSLVQKGVNLTRFLFPTVVGGVLLIVFINFMLQTLGASKDLGTSLYLIYQRIFEVPVVTAYAHFQVFPDMHPNTHFSASRTMNLVLGFGDFVNTGGMAPWEIAAYYSTGLVFNMNTGFMGACWAEMGYIGVIEGAVIIFGLSLFWDLVLIQGKWKGAHYLLAAYFLGRFMNIHNNELMYILLSGGLILAPIVCLVMQLRIRNFAPRTHKSEDHLAVPSGLNQPAS